MTDQTQNQTQLSAVIAALLTPTVEAMRQAGIERISIERDACAVLQMADGSVIGPIKMLAAFERTYFPANQIPYL